MFEGGEKAGARAECVERASGCHEPQSNFEVPFFRPSEAHTRPAVLRRNPATGNQFWDTPVRQPLYEGKLKFPVPGLRIFPCSNGTTSTFEFVSDEPIDEPIAIDAQCRAGWNDQACGFYAFEATRLLDGTYVAVWKAGCSCE